MVNVLEFRDDTDCRPYTLTIRDVIVARDINARGRRVRDGQIEVPGNAARTGSSRATAILNRIYGKDLVRCGGTR